MYLYLHRNVAEPVFAEHHGRHVAGSGRRTERGLPAVRQRRRRFHHHQGARLRHEVPRQEPLRRRTKGHHSGELRRIQTQDPIIVQLRLQPCKGKDFFFF